MSDAELTERLGARLSRTPYNRHFGLALVSATAEPGEVVVRLDKSEAIWRDGERKIIHGGAISGLIDTAAAYAMQAAGARGVTANLRVDYLRPGVDTALSARARVVRAGRTAGLVDVEVSDDEGRAVAVGRAAFSIIQSSDTEGAR